ncbi:MAG: hypothetical protein HC842_07690, partial [Cytophagales bacterium]|nr:hypothetical protein [Cytophagales bacterium]
MKKKILLVLWGLCGACLAQAQNDTYSNSFTGGSGGLIMSSIKPGNNPDAFTFTYENDALTITNHKTEWSFIQNFWTPETRRNLCDKPYVRFLMKADTAVNIGIQLRGTSDTPWKTQALIADGEFHEYFFDFSENIGTIGCEAISEVKMDIPGYLAPGTFIPFKKFYLDDYRLGQAAAPPINAEPSLDPIPDTVLTAAQAESTLPVVLSGINDGDDGSQTLTITSSSNNQNLLADGNITESAISDGVATLSLDFSPGVTGSVLVTITDDGDPNESTTQTFTVFVAKNDGYFTDFSGGNETPFWSGERFYGFTQNEGILEINLNKNQNEVIFGEFQLPTTVDITSNPVLTLSAQTNRDVNFDLRLVDQAGTKSVVKRQLIRSNSGFVLYEYDFTGSSINLAQVAGIEFIPNGHLLAGPTRTMRYTGKVWLDELRLGAGAQSTGLSFAPIKNQTAYVDGGTRTITLFGLSSNITAQSVTSANTTLLPQENITISREGSTATVEYTPVAGQKGEVEVELEVTDGSLAKSQVFTIHIVGNQAPTADPIDDWEVVAGQEYTLYLTGIDDGNPESAQEVSIAVASSDEAKIATPSIISESGDALFTQNERMGTITFQTANSASGTVTLTVTLTDGSGDEEQSTVMEFDVHIFQELNAPPVIDQIEDVQVFVNELNQVQLTGIGDGANGQEELSVSASSSDEAILPSANINFSEIVEGTATLSFTPISTGEVEITLTVTDNGGVENVNNGNQSTEMSFDVTVIPTPITGEVAVYDPANWTADSDDGTTEEIVDDGEGGQAWKLTFTNTKRNWNGQAYVLEHELNLSEYP